MRIEERVNSTTKLGRLNFLNHANINTVKEN